MRAQSSGAVGASNIEMQGGLKVERGDKGVPKHSKRSVLVLVQLLEVEHQARALLQHGIHGGRTDEKGREK